MKLIKVITELYPEFGEDAYYSILGVTKRKIFTINSGVTDIIVFVMLFGCNTTISNQKIMSFLLTNVNDILHILTLQIT